MDKPAETAQLLERVARVVHNDSVTGGLNPTQWEALRYFARANRFSRTPSALTAYLGVTKGTVSQTINALERKGLVRKKTVKGDRRSVSVELAAKGRRLLADDPLRHLADTVGELNAVQRDQLDRTLRALLGKTLAGRDGRPFGLCAGCRHFQRNVDDGKPHRCGLLRVPLSEPDSEQICREFED